MWTDVDDIWPAAASLVGLQFATQADFERCRDLLWEHPDRYHEPYPESLMVAVRKVDAHLVAAAGLAYTEVKLRDMDDIPPEEARRIERALIDEYMPQFVERLRRER
jgi:hypothetical protein